MQRHGGSNRSLPKAAQRKPAVDQPADRSDAADSAPQGGDEAVPVPSIVPDRR
jgi:hypothetical protein